MECMNCKKEATRKVIVGDKIEVIICDSDICLFTIMRIKSNKKDQFDKLIRLAKNRN